MTGEPGPGGGEGPSRDGRAGATDARARLFVAAVPPPDVGAALHRLDRGDRGVRWNDPSSWHVTLRFLGDASVPGAVTAVAALDVPDATARLGPRVELMFGAVVAVPVAGLDELAGSVAAATDAVVDGAPDDREFRGHLTLGRVRGRRLRPGLVGTPIDLVFPVHEVLLFRSERAAAGGRRAGRGARMVHTRLATATTPAGRRASDR